jgi:replicative DNA helicase
LDDPWADSGPGDRLPARKRNGDGGRGRDDRHDRGPDSRWDGGGSGFERVPPQDLDAEQSVLGGMLLSKDAIADVVEVLKGHDFYKPAHETVFQAILDLYAKGEPADPITVSAELTKRGEITKVGGAPYLHTLVQSVPTAANAEYYAEIVHERAVLRRLVEAGTKITQMGYAGDGDVDEIVNSAQAEIYAVTEQRTSEDYAPLGDIMEGALDEIEAIGSRSGQMSGVPTGFTDLDSLTNGLHPGQMIVIAARPAMGKALALDTPLPTPSGWTTMGQVRPGDELLAHDGTPTRVVAATDVMEDRPCYEITFDDGTTVVADAEHQWLTDTRESRRAEQEGSAGERRARAAVRTTEDIAATLHCADESGNRFNHSVRNASPLVLPQRELPVPAYALGVWLGSGHGRAARINTTDSEIVRRLESEGLEVRRVGTSIAHTLKFAVEKPERTERSCAVCGSLPALAGARSRAQCCAGTAGGASAAVLRSSCVDCGKGCFSTSPKPRCATCARRHGSLLVPLRDMGVLGDRHIPQDYLRGSETQRRDLLAGLLDAGGSVTDTGAVRLSVTDRALAEGIVELLMSLGHRCGTATERVEGRLLKGLASGGRSEKSSRAYVIDFTTSDVVFGLQHTRRTHAERAGQGAPGPVRRYITEVRKVESVPVRCVQVDNAEHLYLATRSMVPTHNSTLALDFARACSIQNNMASVIFSLEMGRNEIAMRLLSAEARVALHHMRSGSMTDDDWTRLARRMPDVSAAPLFIDDSPNLSMMEIRAKCRRLKQRQDIKLVIIDYLQLMQAGGSKRSESRQQEVSDMSRNLKLLAKELEVPVIALSQLNRGPEQRTDKKPMVSDLRESGSIEQDADMVILLHREDAYEKESPRAGEADIIVGKHRNGPTATITVAFQGHYSRFVDMAQT